MCGVYGLEQTAFISYNQLVKNMEKYGHYPIPFTTVLWDHCMCHIICFVSVLMTSVFNIFTSMMQIISYPTLPKIIQSPRIGAEITIWDYP